MEGALPKEKFGENLHTHSRIQNPYTHVKEENIFSWVSDVLLWITLSIK
jgi:hypothetical protein